MNLPKDTGCIRRMGVGTVPACQTLHEHFTATKVKGVCTSVKALATANPEPCSQVITLPCFVCWVFSGLEERGLDGEDEEKCEAKKKAGACHV